MKELKTAIVTLMILALNAVTVIAEPPGENGGSRSLKEAERAREHFDMLVMWRMMEALGLDKATGEQVFAVRRKFHAERNAIVKGLREELQILKNKLQDEASKTDEKELSRLIAGVREKRKKLESLQDRQYDEISTVLSVVQQARLLIFMKDFQEEIRAFIHRPMMPPPPGPPPGMPPPPPGLGPSGDPFSGPSDF
ncbi:MAG: hypothetical protein V2B18_18680 [Pseudomonadota bacterium]